MADSALGALLADRRIVVCAGPGGVGKTTTAAALGLVAARSGRRTVVLTVDPARRLATSLGISGMGGKPVRVPFDEGAGELWAATLDVRQTFDELIAREAPSEEAARAVLDHPFYQQLSTSLAGAHEYMAMERLYELSHDRQWDIVILDTPPTHHALDFLSAPARMEAFFSGPGIELVRRGARAAGRMSRGLVRLNALVLRGVGRFIGTDLFVEILAFAASLAELGAGFARRANEVGRLLRHPSVGFVLVAGPDTATVHEMLFFARRLHREAMHVAAVLLNRVRKPPAGLSDPHDVPSPQETEARLWREAPVRMHPRALVRDTAAALVAATRNYLTLAEGDVQAIQTITRAVPAHTAVLRVPLLDFDVHDLTSLAAFADAVEVAGKGHGG